MVGVLGDAQSLEEEPILTTYIVEDEAEFAGLREEWNALALGSGSTVCQTWDWASAWWNVYARGSGCILRLLSVRDGGKLIAVCPLFVEPIHLLGFCVGRETRLIGSVISRSPSRGLFAWYSPSDYLDIIVMRGREREVLPLLAAHIEQELSKGNRRVSFVNLRPQSLLREHLRECLQHSNLRIQHSNLEACPKLELPPTVDEFLSTLGSNARRRWKKIKSAVEDTDTFRIRSIQTVDEFDAAFQLMKLLHQRRWQNVGFPGVFFDKNYSAFLEGACRDLFASGHLWFRVLEYHNRVIAGRVGLLFGDTLYDYLSGFDDDPGIAKHRPGLMLLYLMISDGIERKLKTLDLLRGDESYKSEISSSVETNTEVVIVRSGFLSAVRRAALSLLLVLRKLKHRLENEVILLRVHSMRTRGILAFSRYVRFRVGQGAVKLKQRGEP